MSRSTIRFSTRTPTPTGEGAHFSPDTNARQRKVRFGGLFFCLREARIFTHHKPKRSRQANTPAPQQLSEQVLACERAMRRCWGVSVLCSYQQLVYVTPRAATSLEKVMNKDLDS